AIGVSKWRHMYEQRRWIFLYLRERLDWSRMFGEHRRLCWRGVLQRSHLHRPSWGVLLQVYTWKD
ncbi:unnamed protein product, partial [Leptidea sinapis]